MYINHIVHNCTYTKIYDTCKAQMVYHEKNITYTTTRTHHQSKIMTEEILH